MYMDVLNKYIIFDVFHFHFYDWCHWYNTNSPTVVCNEVEDESPIHEAEEIMQEEAQADV